MGLKEIIDESDLVMLDIDGTLLKTNERHKEAMLRMNASIEAETGINVNAFVPVEDQVSLPMVYIKERAGLPYAVEELQERYSGCYASSEVPAIVYDNAVEAIHLLISLGKLTVAVTGAGKAVAEINMGMLQEKWDRSGFKCEMFDAFVHADEVAHPKPHLDAYYAVVRKLSRRFDPRDVVMVGDGNGDSAFARNIGCPFVYVSDSGFNPEIRESAACTVKDMHEFYTLLRG